MVFDASQKIEESKTVVGVWNETIEVSESGSIKSIADAISKMDHYCAYTIKVNGALTTPQSIDAETDYGGYSDQSFYSITIESYGSTKQAINLGWTESGGEWTNTNLDDPEPALTINTDDTIIIKNLIITGGYAEYGGGIFIDHNDANVTITDGAEITGNGAINDGGGVYVNNGKLTMNGTAKIENNTAGGGESNNGRGGGVYLNYATFKMGGGTISGNEAKAQTNGNSGEVSGYGGGVYIGIAASMYMYGNAVVGDASATAAATAENHSNMANCGGGVYVEGHSTRGAGNLYLGYNGGVDDNYNDVKVTLTGGIYYNYAANNSGENVHDAGCGGGVSVQNGHANASYYCSVVMNSGDMAYNTAESDGGGIYLQSKSGNNNVSARFTMSGGSVSSNNAGGNGKAVYVGQASSEKFAIFNISGDATLAADNDVFLAGNQAQINIDGELSNTNVATITPATYATTVQVLGGGAGAIAASCGKFAVAPNGGAVDWIVNTNGYLQIYKPEGGLGGKFSVGDGKQVYFSQGNLQYQASTQAWQFAENQWEHIGNNPGNTVTGEARATQSDWIDLFGWGTSGNNNDPYMTDQTGNYGDGANDIAGTQYDWGVKNAISNGGGVANKWRTLTSGEWTYLLKTRTTSSGLRYAMAQVQGVNGLVLLPDNWSTSTYTFSSTNPSISNENWSKIEAAGAVFLPVTGYRMVSEMYYADLYGNYWSSSTTSGSTTNAGGICFDANDLTNDDSFSRYFGRAVRLVQDVVVENGGGDDGITLYVDPDGDDNYDGTTRLQAVKTFEQALSLMTEAKPYTIELVEGNFTQEVQTLNDDSGVNATKITIDGKGKKISLSSSEPLLKITTEIPVEIKNLEISGNTSGGGGLYVEGSNCTVTLGEGTKIINNNAGSGGGVRNEGQLIIDGAEISGNTATDNGGGIYVEYDGKIDMRSGSISNNTAGRSGGGIYFYGSTVTLTGGTISGNIANGDGGDGGGAIYAGCQSTFSMGGSVYIPAGVTVSGEIVTGYGKNDVQLDYYEDYGHMDIRIVSNLTAEASVVATITPTDYSGGYAVVRGYNIQTSSNDNGLLEANYNKFAVTPQTKDEEGEVLDTPVVWYVDSEGKLTTTNPNP